MSKPYDASLNPFIDEFPNDWAAFLAARTGVPLGPVSSIDTDLSTTLQADRLFRIDGSRPTIIHLELESGGDLGLPRTLLRYNTHTHFVHKIPVRSVVMLLRPQANASDRTGEYILDDAEEYLRFRYTVIRVWQESLTDLLQCGPGIAPLALLTRESQTDLPKALDAYVKQLRKSNLPGNLEEDLLGSLFVLSGLLHDPVELEQSFRKLAMTLEDSATYQLILQRGILLGESKGHSEGIAEGRIEGRTEGRMLALQEAIQNVGGELFGSKPTASLLQLQAITDPDRLKRMMASITKVATWDELLAIK